MPSPGPESDTGQYMCIECSETFDTKLELTSHRQSHVAKKQFTCTHCGRGFHHQVFLQMHERSHEEGVSKVKTPPPRVISTRSSKMVDIVHVKPTYTKPSRPLNSIVHFKTEPKVCQTFTPKEFLTRRCHGSGLATSQKEDAPEKKNLFELRISKFSDTTVHLIDSFGNSIEILTDVFNTYTIAEPEENGVNTNADKVPTKNVSPDETSSKSLTEEPSVSPQTKPADMDNDRPPSSELITSESAASEKPEAALPLPELSNAESAVIPEQEPMESQPSSETMENVSEKLSVQPSEVSEEKVNQGQAIDSIIDGNLPANDDMDTTPEDAASPTSPQKQQNELEVDQIAKLNSTLLTDEPIGSADESQDKRLEDSAQLPDCSSLGDPGSSKNEPKTIEENKQPEEEMIPNEEQAQDLTLPKSDAEVGQVNPPEEISPNSREELSPAMSVNVSEDRPPPEISLHNQSSKEEADLSNTLLTNRDVSSPTEDTSIDKSAEDLRAQNEQSPSSEECSGISTIIPEKQDLQSASLQENADKNLKTDICMTSEDVGEVSISEGEVGLPERDLQADNKEPEKHCSLLSGQDMLHDDDDDGDGELVIDDKRDEDLFERDIFPLEVCEKGLASVEEQNIACEGEAHSTKIVQEKESDICLNGSEMTYISESEMIKLLEQDKDDIGEDEPVAAVQKDLETMRNDDQAFSQSKLEPELSNSEETKSSRSPVTGNGEQNTVDEMLTGQGSELPACMEEETSEVQLDQNKLKTTDHVGLPSENHNLPTYQAPPNEKMETGSCSPLSFLTSDEPRTGESPNSIESMLTQDSVSKNSSEEQLAPSSGNLQPITAEGITDLPQPEQDLPCRDQNYEPSGTSENQDLSPVGDAAMCRTEHTHEPITPEEEKMDVCVTVEDNECDDEQTDSLEGPSLKDAVIQSGQEKPHTSITGYEGLACSIEPEQSKTKVGEIDGLSSKEKDVIDPEPLAKHDAETNAMICNKERKSKLKNVDQESKNPPLDVLDDMQSTSNDDGDHAKAKSPERRNLKDEGMQDKQVDQDAVFLLKENENDDAETDICSQEQTTDLSCNLESSSKTASTNENVESKKSSLDKKLSPKGAEDHELGELPTGALEDNSLPKDMEEDSEKTSAASPKDIESEVMDVGGSATKQGSDVASPIGQAVCKDSLQDPLEDSELMDNDHQEDVDNTETPSKPPGVGGECLKCGRKIRRGRKEMIRLPVCFKCRKAAKRQERLSNQETADAADLAIDPLKSKRSESLSVELSDSPIKQDGDPLIPDPFVDEKEASGSATKKRYKCPKCDKTFRIPALLAGHIKCHTLPQCLTCGCPMQLKYKTKRIPRRCQKCVQQLKEKRAEKKVVEGSGDEYSAISDDEDADINPDNDISDEDSQVSPLDEEVDFFKKDREKSKKQEIESSDELDTSDQNLDLHDSEKPRLCPQCSKAFRCNRSLNLHLLSHTAVQCESCGCRLSKRRKIGRWSKKCRSCRLQIKGKLLTDSGDELSLSGDKLPKQKNVASLRLKAKQAKMSKNSKIQSIIKKKKELKWMNMLLAVRGLMDKSRKKKESALKAAELAKKDGESSEAEKCDASSAESTSIQPDDPKYDLHDTDMEKAAGSSELLPPLNKTPKQGRKCLYREKNIIKVEESEVLPYIPDSTFIKQEETWQCLECNQTWPNSEALVNHQHSHTTGQSFTCPQCPQVFSTEQFLDLHVHSHDDDGRPYRCPECDKTFTKRNNLGVHMRVHAGSRPFACPDCPRRFRQKVTLLAHRYSHRNYELLFAKPFQCSVCSKSFKMKERLVVHERLHTGECPFSCKDCDKAFPSKARLYVHRKLHKISQDPSSSSDQNLSNEISEGQPFKCQDCGKVCSTKASFVLHRKIHRLSSMPVKIIKRERSEEEHPFGCKECNKVFSSKGNLTFHLKNHSAHKVTAKSEMSPDSKGCFPCKDCDKVCSTKASFALHRRIHKSPSDGEPNPIIKVESDTPGYVCNYCNKVCSTKASLVLHRRVHKTPGSADSETKSFKCKDCDMVFSTKVSYLLHRKVHRSASKSQKSPKAGAEPQSYNCKHCEMVCSTKASFVLHSKVHKTPTTSEQNLKADEEPQSYNCKHCDMVCSTKASFILHSKVHRSLVGEQSPKGVEEPHLYNCKYCDMVCSTKASFILHSKVHRSLFEGEQSPKTSEEPQLYNCKHCDMVCSTKASFVLHSKVHRSLVGEQSPKEEGLKSFRCKKCDMVCSTKASFVLHSKVHKSGQNLQANTEQKPFTCKVCKKVCSTKASFILHRKVHKSSSSENNPTPKADGEESTFPCKDCDKVYSSKGRLAFHINKVHEDSSSHDQNASNESNPEQPKKTTEEKPFSCTICELRFAKLKMLVRHKVVHGDRTITPCLHCGKRFLYMKSLFNHMKICQSKGKGKKLLLLKKAAVKRKIPKDTASTSSDGESAQKKRKVDEKQKALKAAQKLKNKNLTIKSKKAAISKEKGKGKGTKEKRAKVDGEGASEVEGKKTTTEKQSDGKEEEKPSEQTAKEPTLKKKTITKVKKITKEPTKEKTQKVGGPKKWRVLAASTIKKKNLQAIIIGGKKKVLIKKKVQMKPKSGAKAGKD